MHTLTLNNNTSWLLIWKIIKIINKTNKWNIIKNKIAISRYARSVIINNKLHIIDGNHNKHYINGIIKIKYLNDNIKYKIIYHIFVGNDDIEFWM